MEALAARAQLEDKALSSRLPHRAGLCSVACDLSRCSECDGLVHQEPVAMNGADLSHVPEMERPRDLRPWRCDCGCHSGAFA
jgi:hypothetical protein